MRITRKAGLAIAAGALSVGAFGAAGYAYFESAAAPSAQPTASSAPAVSEDTAAASPAPTTRGVPADTMKQIAKSLAGDAAQYLGMKPVDVMTDLKAGKTLAELANAAPGKSRDGLVAALTTDADAKIDAAVADGTLTAEQAATAKQKLSGEIAKLVDRAGKK